MGEEIIVENDLLDCVLFTYSIDHMLQKDKVRFYYALKGRDGISGMLSKEGVLQLGRAVVIVSRELAPEFEEFFSLWKCDYHKKNILLPRNPVIDNKE